MDDFSWFVGLFEGEGYIGSTSDKCVQIVISGSDKDVMDKVSSLLEKNYVEVQPKGKHTYKKQYRISIVGKKARYIVENIKPYMSERRQEKIEQVLAANKPKGKKVYTLPFIDTI